MLRYRCAPLLASRDPGEGHHAEQKELTDKSGQRCPDIGGRGRGRTGCLQRLQARHRGLEQVQGSHEDEHEYSDTRQKDQQGNKATGQIGAGRGHGHRAGIPHIEPGRRGEFGLSWHTQRVRVKPAYRTEAEPEVFLRLFPAQFDKNHSQQCC